jgi:SAM-dependent methyltransferase
MKRAFTKISGSLTRDPEQWKRLWLEAQKGSPVNRRELRGEPAEVERWNLRASSYAEHSESEESRNRRDQILTWLENEGALQPSFRVLDIGAGPGNFAIPLSRKVAEVVALEPAEEMVSILERRIGDEGIENIRVVQKTWEEVNNVGEDWKGAFELVFASMSPGISNPQMLEKMIAASKAFCYLSGWSGGRWGKWGLAQREIWPLLFGEELGDYPGDILYPFGMLYALGYRPELRFFRPRVHLEMSAEEAIEGLIDHFNRYVEGGPDIRKTITSYVRRNSRMGTFRQVSTTCQGFMLWPVARD